jgi:putative hydrolase of the HAD superfamily
VSPIKAIVFDLDDTLFLEREFVLSGFGAIDIWLSKELGIDGFQKKARGSFERGVRGRNIDLALEELGVPVRPELIRKLVGIYREHAPLISLCADAVWAIDHFRKEYALGLITDGYLATQRNKVKALGIEHTLQHIIYTDQEGPEYWKPNPRCYMVMSATLRCGAGECVYVADNPRKDFVAPKALGWRTVRIRREGGEHSHEVADQSQDAERSIISLEQLRSCLSEMDWS